MSGRSPRAGTIAAAERNRAAIREVLTAHRKICAECHRGEVPALDYCDEGYEISKQLAVADSVLAGRRAAAVEDWPGLF